MNYRRLRLDACMKRALERVVCVIIYTIRYNLIFTYLNKTKTFIVLKSISVYLYLRLQ